MDIFWKNLSNKKKTYLLLKSLNETPNQESPIACRICDQIFLDSRSLFNHFLSNHGTLNMRLLIGSLMSSANGTNFFSHSSQFTRSPSLRVNFGNSSAKHPFKQNAKQNFSPAPNLGLGRSYVVPTLLGNSVQLRGPILTQKHQSYPSPSNSHSSIESGTFSSQTNQLSNFNSRFVSQPTGPPAFLHSPRSRIIPGAFTSQSTQLSNCFFPLSSVASTSQPTRQSNSHSPISFGPLALESVPGSSSLALHVLTSSHLQSTGKNEVEDPGTNFTKPLIMQLEHPIEKMMVGDCNDKGGDNMNPDVIDLTLKL